MRYEDYTYEEWEAMRDEFADPGGDSALRAASADNPRNEPCPTCHGENLLTPKDVQLGYQCDGCANAAERGMDAPWNCPDEERRHCTICADNDACGHCGQEVL